MNFNSWQYLVFFPVVFLLYYGITAKNRRHSNRIAQCLLLTASLFFYACWHPAYLGLILLSVAVTWSSGLLMEGRTRTQRRLVLAASLIINLGILFFFKYYGFFADTIYHIGAVFGLSQKLRGNALGALPQPPAFNVLLPVGISFYTFQALGYSIDVYRGTVKAERDFLSYALFVTFFLQLVAGPIERSAALLPQFKTNHPFDYGRVTGGLKLAAWGMFKKVVIADRLAVYVNAVYAAPGEFPATALLLATFFFAFQIYCDFSGYSDIAIGCARALGFELMTNFRRPYFARSITDFWRRWHISLTTWFRDYVYIPLGGNRRGLPRQCLNILIVFALSGLWHGAAWHFVAWGLVHGVLQVMERLWEGKWKVESRKWIKISNGEIHFPLSTFHYLFTFPLVCLAWVLFRAGSLSDAGLIFGKFAGLPGELGRYLAGLPRTGLVGMVREMFQLGSWEAGVEHPIEGFALIAFGLSLLFIALLVMAEALTRKTEGTKMVMRWPLALRWAGYYALSAVIAISWGQTTAQFIYFTF